MAFLARLEAPGDPFVEGLVAMKRSGELVALAATGFPFEVVPGDVRIVQQVHTTQGDGGGGPMNGDDGGPTFLNDRGEIAFLLWFADDSSGLFRTSFPTP
jgi:hypothetical protein